MGRLAHKIVVRIITAYNQALRISPTILSQISNYNLSILTGISLVTADSRGIRTDCGLILDTLKKELDVIFGFVGILQTETDKFDIIAATGLDAADFRRLETRAGSSALMRVFDLRESITLLVNDEPSLDFLSNPAIVGELISAPIILSQACVGSISLAFDKTKFKDRSNVIHLLEIVAAMIAQSLRAERLEREESRKLAEENTHLKQELKEKYDFSHLIGNSSPMRQVYDQVTQVARSNATIMIRGESGTGKELIANAIHYNSLRSKRPFIKLNCAALPETLIKSELFGYEQGAFTGAAKRKKGRFEMAEGGTIFLDEVGDLPPQTQVKLLRVLQEREFERLGGTETIKVNVRLITATNKDLEASIINNSFREDLFYRLNVFTIFLPPLRERKADILQLAEHFMKKYEAEHGKRILRISTPAIDMLTAYHYPGNVRELENAIEHAVLVCDSNVIHGHHLPPTLQTAEVSGTETRVTLESAVAAFERDLIQDALKSTRGNVTKAAKMLDSTERILGYKIKKYAIDTIRFRKWNAKNFS